MRRKSRDQVRADAIRYVQQVGARVAIEEADSEIRKSVYDVQYPFGRVAFWAAVHDVVTQGHRRADAVARIHEHGDWPVDESEGERDVPDPLDELDAS